MQNDRTSDVELRLSRFLPYRLNVAATAVSDGLARIYTERFGIGVPEWRVLATLGEFETMTAKAIGAHSHMGKVKVSRAVSALETKKLIRRESNEGDKREAFLRLTAAGQAIYAEIVPLALDYARRLRAVFSAEDLESFERVIDKLVEMAEPADLFNPDGRG